MEHVVFYTDPEGNPDWTGWFIVTKGPDGAVDDCVGAYHSEAAACDLISRFDASLDVEHCEGGA